MFLPLLFGYECGHFDEGEARGLKALKDLIFVLLMLTMRLDFCNHRELRLWLLKDQREICLFDLFRDSLGHCVCKAVLEVVSHDRMKGIQQQSPHLLIFEDRIRIIPLLGIFVGQNLAILDY